MTPKKDIVRKPTYTLPDGSPIPEMGKFKPKENAFIYWYTNPKTEAFMNSGRAAVRAGYKASSAVLYGYKLKQKQEISEIIDELLGNTKEGMRALIYNIAFLCWDRFTYNTGDFYRPCKRIVKRRGVELEVKSLEAIPLNEISKENRMCIDNIDIKTIRGKNETFYKLADRDKAIDTFFKCLEIITGKRKSQLINQVDVFSIEEEDITYKIIREGVKIAPTKEATHWRKAAEFLRGDDAKSLSMA